MHANASSLIKHFVKIHIVVTFSTTQVLEGLNNISLSLAVQGEEGQTVAGNLAVWG